MSSFERCALDPARAEANRASVVEAWLVSLNEKDFQAQKPERLLKMAPDAPVETGVSWIDEMERGR
jgi:hypothetical protein